MANYLDLTRKAYNGKHRLPQIKGQVSPHHIVTNSDYRLEDHDSGSTIFLGITGNTDINISLPAPRLGLYFKFINTLSPTGSGDAVIKSRDLGNTAIEDNIVVQSTGPIQMAVSPVYSLTFSAATVTSNSIAGNVESTALSATAFDTNSDTTLAALATKLQALDSIASAAVTAVASATDNDRVILITGAVKGKDLEFSGFTVTGGASQPTIAIVTETEPMQISASTAVNNLLADNVKVEAGSTGGEWIEFIADDSFWYSRVSNVNASSISMNG